MRRKGEKRVQKRGIAVRVDEVGIPYKVKEKGGQR